MVEAERAQDAHGVGVAATGGDDDLDAGGFGGQKGGEVARADAAVVTEEGAVHVDGDHADGVGCCLQGTLPPYISKTHDTNGLQLGIYRLIYTLGVARAVFLEISTTSILLLWHN